MKVNLFHILTVFLFLSSSLNFISSTNEQSDSLINSTEHQSITTFEEEKANSTDYNYQQQSYKLKLQEMKKIERLNNFYKKAVDNFSSSKLEARINQETDNLHVIATTEIKIGEEIFSIPKNHTISSFDNFFPYFNEAEEVFKKLKTNKTENIFGNDETKNLVKLVLNILYVENYVYKDNDSQIIKDGNLRWFKIYFKHYFNLNNTLDYVPFWEDEVHAFARRMRPNESLMKYFEADIEPFFSFFEELRNKISNKNKAFNKEVLNKVVVFNALNLVLTRSLLITLKGWKVINGLSNKIKVEDIDNYGFILIPGADSINHESGNSYNLDYVTKFSGKVKNYKSLASTTDYKIQTNPEENYIMKSNLEYSPGKVILKASRNYKTGEEVKINYDHVSGVLETFKKIGYISLESIIEPDLQIESSKPILHNSFLKHDVIQLKDIGIDTKKLLVTHQLMRSDPEGDTFITTRYTNSFDQNMLTIYQVLNYSKYKKIDDKNVLEISKLVESNTLPLEIKALGLSDFLKDYYKSITYSMNFRASIDDLLKVYIMSLNGTKFKDIASFMGYSGFKFSTTHDTITNHKRLRELIKLFLVYQHVCTINVYEAFARLDKNLDEMYLNIRNNVEKKAKRAAKLIN